MKISEIGDLAVIFETIQLDGVERESIDRLSCSKHYYHLFHIVSNWLKTKFRAIFDCSGGGTHQAIRTSCELLADKFNDRDFKKLAFKLKQLHDMRVHADYRLGEDLSRHAILMMKSEKQKAIELISELDKKHSSETLKQA